MVQLGQYGLGREGAGGIASAGRVSSRSISRDGGGTAYGLGREGMGGLLLCANGRALGGRASSGKAPGEMAVWYMSLDGMVWGRSLL